MNFSSWFKDSKAINENYEPAVLYHGTLSVINKFHSRYNGSGNDIGKGYYFSSCPKDASNNYASIYRGDPLPKNVKQRHAGCVIPVHLSIQNPIILGKDPWNRFEETSFNVDDILCKFLYSIYKNLLCPRDFKFLSDNSITADNLHRSMPYYLEEKIDGGLVFNKLIKYFGYDGVIDFTVSYKWKGFHLNNDTAHYIVFRSNQIRSIYNKDVPFSTKGEK
jgi:ADP-Ribosyltransferase in polyvalent proteins